MGLKDFKISEETIKTSGGEFAVRGLSLTDILTLSGKYYPVMEQLFEQFTADTSSEKTATVKKEMAASLISGAPNAVAEVIALAAGDGDDAEAVDAAKKLPFTVQIEALQKIGALTFKSEEDLGNAVAAVISMLQGSGKAIAQLNKQGFQP